MRPRSHRSIKYLTHSVLLFVSSGSTHRCKAYCFTTHFVNCSKILNVLLNIGGLKILMNISKLSTLNLEGLLTWVELILQVTYKILLNYCMYCSVEHHGLMCSWHSTNIYGMTVSIIFPDVGRKEIWGWIKSVSVHEELGTRQNEKVLALTLMVNRVWIKKEKKPLSIISLTYPKGELNV